MQIIIFIEILFLIFVDSEHNKETRRKRANTWHKSSEETGNASDKHACRTRYQQTPVEVYARFIAVDQVKDKIHFIRKRKKKEIIQ